jgi:hypothetical protein
MIDQTQLTYSPPEYPLAGLTHNYLTKANCATKNGILLVTGGKWSPGKIPENGLIDYI